MSSLSGGANPGISFTDFETYSVAATSNYTIGTQIYPVTTNAFIPGTTPVSPLGTEVFTFRSDWKSKVVANGSLPVYGIQARESDFKVWKEFELGCTTDKKGELTYELKLEALKNSSTQTSRRMLGDALEYPDWLSVSKPDDYIQEI